MMREGEQNGEKQFDEKETVETPNTKKGEPRTLTSFSQWA
jgi:hypothetical protein